MIIDVDEIETGEFESLEEYVRYVESKANIPNSDTKKRTRLELKLIQKWHDTYGFTVEDEEYVMACSYDVESFIDEKNKREIKEYRREREKIISEKDDYAGDLYKSVRKKNRHLDKKTLKLKAQEEHDREQTIYACMYRTYKYLMRENEKLETIHADIIPITAELLAEKTQKMYASELKMINIAQIVECAKTYLSDVNQNGMPSNIALSVTTEDLLRRLDAFLEKKQQKIIAWSLVGITAFNLLLLIIRFIVCLITLDRVVVSNNEIYIAASIILSAVAFIYATTQDYFNFYNVKWRIFVMVLINDAATLLQLLYTVLWNTLVVAVFKIKPNDMFTPDMVVMLARILVCAGMVMGVITEYKLIHPFVTVDEAKEKILAFKLRHIVDNRENKDYKYDFCVVYDLKTGKPIIVKEHDLYTHALLLGASGTGKTSSIYMRQIIENIRKRRKNRDMQQREVLKMVKTGEVIVTQAFTRDTFGRQYFKPLTADAARRLDKIFEDYQQCGITAVAPNNSMNEDTLDYTSGIGEWVNNIDPSKKKPTHPYERLVGMNPFYMPPRFHAIKPGDEDAEEDRTVYIAEAANNFADALTAINELNGSSDAYFTDVNTTVTSAIVTILMLDASIKDIQITIEDVYACIQDFDLISAHISDIKRHFNIKHEAKSVDPKNNRGRSNPISTPPDTDDDEEAKAAREDESRAQMYQQLSDEDKKNPYIQTIITCDSHLQKGSTMDIHAAGLRNLIRKLLQDPRVKRILVSNKDIIDFNEILENNEITVVNTALEFGKNTSTCFGQLFLLNFNTAVLRRKRHTRTPHYLFEDETARYLSDIIDTMVTLYRQYCVSCMFALQSLDQVKKVPHLAYLKDTLLSAGMIIEFGRASNDDAKIISEMGGQVRYDMVQKTESHTSLLSENASSSFSERTTPNQKNYVDPHDVRYRDFQELTMLYTDGGNVMPARLGKAIFVPKEVLKKVDQKQIDYSDTWRQIWKNRYPLTEEVVNISPDTTISPKNTQDTAAMLLNRSSMSAEITYNDVIEASVNRDNTYNVKDLSDVLNTDRNNVQPINEESILDRVRDDDDEDDIVFSDEITEEEKKYLLKKSMEIKISVNSADPLEKQEGAKSILVYDDSEDDYDDSTDDDDYEGEEETREENQEDDDLTEQELQELLAKKQKEMIAKLRQQQF